MPNNSISHVQIETHENATQYGFYIDNPKSKTTLIFFQGNGMKIDPYCLPALTTLSKLNTDILIIDRRGLGAREGQPTIRNLNADAKLQLDYVRQQHHPKKVILHGYSIGSFIAANLAKHAKIDALVLHGSATNANDWIDERTPWYIAPFMTLEMPDNVRAIDNGQIVAHHYQAPLRIIVGEHDEEVPAILSEKLYSASQSANKALILVPAANHENMLDNPKTIEQYKEFLSSL